jgi:flagellar hook-associated protein 1 FlgK
VNIDEEMTNMLQFQHAYDAAARFLTAVDQTLDTLINSTGLVGRG